MHGVVTTSVFEADAKAAGLTETEINAIVAWIAANPLEHFLRILNRSAGGNLGLGLPSGRPKAGPGGRGLRRRSGWWPGQVRSPMDLAQIHPARRVPASGRPLRQADLADEPHRPSPPSWRIASPSEKQSDPVFTGNALAGDIMQGTGGARKVRFPRPGKGKSGGYRTIHYYGGIDVPIFLLALVDKGERANLSKAERNMLARELVTLADDYRAGVSARAARKKW